MAIQHSKYRNENLKYVKIQVHFKLFFFLNLVLKLLSIKVIWLRQKWLKAVVSTHYIVSFKILCLLQICRKISNEAVLYGVQKKKRRRSHYHSQHEADVFVPSLWCDEQLNSGEDQIIIREWPPSWTWKIIYFVSWVKIKLGKDANSLSIHINKTNIKPIFWKLTLKQYRLSL